MRPLYWRWSSSFALCEMWTTNTMYKVNTCIIPYILCEFGFMVVDDACVLLCVEYLYTHARTSKVFLQLLIPSKVMRVNLKVTFGKPSVYEFLPHMRSVYTLQNFASCVKWLYVHRKNVYMALYTWANVACVVSFPNKQVMFS